MATILDGNNAWSASSGVNLAVGVLDFGARGLEVSDSQRDPSQKTLSPEPESLILKLKDSDAPAGIPEPFSATCPMPS